MELIESVEKELNECEGYAANKRLISFINSLLIYQANVNELKQWYQKLNDPQAILVIWNSDNYALMEKTNVEMQRLFSNFLFSAYSLREHLYALRNRYYMGTVIEDKINDNIKKYFVANNITAFIQGFRNFVVHCGFPSISKRMSLSSMSNDIFFDKEQLSKFDGWPSKAQDFIKTIDGQIKLIDIVIGFDKIANEYYAEIIRCLTEYHIDELKQLKSIKKKHNLKITIVKI